MSALESEEVKTLAFESYKTYTESISGNTSKDQILRIEEELVATWGGVKGCCDDGTPQKQVDAVFNQWVGAKIKENSPRRYLNSGHGGGTARCSGSKPTGGARKCRGTAKVQAWIEFLR